MLNLWQDLRYGARMLLKKPGFTLIAVITLALGIGANTTIFGLIDAVLLKMLPVKNPEQLVVLKRNRVGDVTFDFSYPLFLRLREQNQVFSSIFAAQAGPGRVTMRLSGSIAHEQAEDAAREIVSGDYFSTLGVSAILGRVLTPEDDKTFGAHPVAVISHSFWQRRFGADTSVLGKVITLREIPFTIIGVTPPGFFGIEVGKSTDVWISMMMVSERNFLSDNNSWLRVIARLKPEVTEQQASAEMSRILQRHHAERAEGINDTNLQKELLAQTIGVEAVGKGLSDLRVRFSQPLYVLMVIVVLLLLIACANLANLLLARAGARQKEIAVRLALGAGRLRLIRQLFTESLLLALMGGSLGLIIALWGRELLLTFLPAGPLPLTLDLAPDLRVLGFTAAVSCMACLLFGLAPAWRTTRVNLYAWHTKMWSRA
jgi:predicted permease